MEIDFEKGSGLVPAIVQDSKTGKVLMLAYMNQEALDKTHSSGNVTFYSRSRQALWTKGETSGNFLLLEKVYKDCDSDTLLIKARPTGPVCHLGSDTCFGESNCEMKETLLALEEIIIDRKLNPKEGSYTTELFEKGLSRIAQKVGEEAVELIIAAKDGNKAEIMAECADMLYHMLVLLQERNISLQEVLETLEKRRVKR